LIQKLKEQEKWEEDNEEEGEEWFDSNSIVTKVHVGKEKVDVCVGWTVEAYDKMCSAGEGGMGGSAAESEGDEESKEEEDLFVNYSEDLFDEDVGHEENDDMSEEEGGDTDVKGMREKLNDVVYFSPEQVSRMSKTRRRYMARVGVKIMDGEGGEEEKKEGNQSYDKKETKEYEEAKTRRDQLNDL